MVSKTGQTGTYLAIAIIVTALVAGTAGYFLAPEKITETEIPTLEKIKVGFMYIGPLAGSLWNEAHDSARLYVDNTYEQIETLYVEDVVAGDVANVIESMFAQDTDVVICTAFDFIVETVEMAEKYPDKIFYILIEDMGTIDYLMGEDFVRPSNIGVYFNDMYQAYYLNGLMAGALTETNKLGYLLPYELAETIKYVNAFTLGAREVNPEAQVKTILVGAWYDPPTEILATETLIDWGADIINSQMDSPTYIERLQQYYDETGEKILAFGTDMPAGDFGPDVVLGGQLFKWQNWYEPLLLKALHGEIETWEHMGLLNEEGVVWGFDWDTPINPMFTNDLQAISVTDPLLGTINIYDLLMARLEEFKDPRVTHLVFIGPVRDTDGTLRWQAGETPSAYDLHVLFDWYVEGVIPS